MATSAGSKPKSGSTIKGRHKLKAASHNAKDTALLEAAFRGKTKELEKVLKKGADKNCADEISGDTALLIASQMGNADFVDALLSSGVDVSVKNRTGHTALHKAAAFGHVEVVKLLLGKGSSPIDPQDNEGQTPMHLALLRKQWGTFIQLLDAGADIHAATNEGKQAIHIACSVDFTKGTGQLCKKGANVNEMTAGTGNTPLHIAAVNGSSGCVAALLGHGADVNLLNRAGQTPAALALQSGHTVMAQLLRKQHTFNANGSPDTASPATGSPSSPLSSSFPNIPPPPGDEAPTPGNPALPSRLVTGARESRAHSHGESSRSLASGLVLPPALPSRGSSGERVSATLRLPTRPVSGSEITRTTHSSYESSSGLAAPRPYHSQIELGPKLPARPATLRGVTRPPVELPPPVLPPPIEDLAIPNPITDSPSIALPPAVDTLSFIPPPIVDDDDEYDANINGDVGNALDDSGEAPPPLPTRDYYGDLEGSGGFPTDIPPPPSD